MTVFPRPTSPYRTPPERPNYRDIGRLRLLTEIDKLHNVTKRRSPLTMVRGMQVKKWWPRRHLIYVYICTDLYGQLNCFRELGSFLPPQRLDLFFPSRRARHPTFFSFLSFFSWHRGVKREDVRYLGQNMTKQVFRGGGGGGEIGGLRASSSTLWPIIGLS